MKLLMVFLLIFAVSNIAFSFDESVNRSFEKRMHDVYKSSYSVEVPDDEWANYVEKIEDNKYQVKAGDTLWDLSKVFFGDGFFWSKIWSYNSSITNPHLLSVGVDVQFFSGSISSPPSMDVNGEPISEGSVTITRSSEKLDIPESVQTVAPVLNQLPPAFKDKASLAGSNKYDKTGMSFDIRPPVRVNPLFIVHAFLYDGSASSYPRTGNVFEAEEGNLAMSTFQQFYFEATKGYAVGDEVTVMGKDYDFGRMGVSGDVIRYLGRAKVTDVMSDGRYRAEIKNSLGPVTIKSWVTDEMIPSFADDNSGRASEVAVDIVGGAIENNRALLAKSSVLFLDGGSDVGLRVGDILGVYKVRKHHYKKYDVEVSPTPIGHIKIFRAGPNVSSAFVIDSKEAIVPGDKTGRPEFVTGTITKSEVEDLNDLEDGLDTGEGDDLSEEGVDDLEDDLEDELETI